VRHPTRSATAAAHPHPPHPAPNAHPARIPRPQLHRPAAARTVQTWDLDLPTGGCVLLDAQRAGPYDGHGDLHRLGPSRERQLTTGGSFACSRTGRLILPAGRSPSQITAAGPSPYVIRQSCPQQLERGTGARTVQYVHATIRKALNDAVRWGLLVRNPALHATPPKHHRRELQTWTAEQLRRFLDTVHGERLSAAWRLAALTGMRRDEVLGLRWADVDLDGG
jgi:hypothetical protein